MQNLGLKMPHFGEIKGQVEILSTLSEICSSLLELCQNFVVSVRKFVTCPAYFF